MKAYDFYAVTYDGAVYCTEHLPEGVTLDSDGVYPIFADSEWDSYPVCDVCLREHAYVILLQPEKESHEHRLRAATRGMSGLRPSDV